MTLAPEMESALTSDSVEYIERFFNVLTKADRQGQSQLVPMSLKPVQRAYIEGRTTRDIILKARQMGVSTGVLASNCHKVFTAPFHRMAVVAHRGDSAEFMLQTVHRFYNNLPRGLRPRSDWKSATKIRFPALDAIIHIDSAQSRAIGRSESLTIVHLSETAHWPEDNIQELWAGISQTASPGAFITIESSPRGRGGFFYQMYHAAKRGENGFKAFFFPWWHEPEYSLPITKPLQLTEEEELLVDNYGLKPEQIAWRRTKQRELRELFYQEYPENDVDCFFGGENNVFDGVTVRKYLRNVRPGERVGDWTIWKDVVGGRKYVIGVDAAGGLIKGDFSAAVVLETRANEHVATFRGKAPPDLFAEEVYRMAKTYNNALVAVERETHGHTVLHILLERNYENLYYHKDYDVWQQRVLAYPGWVTSGKTKPLMIDAMKAALRAGDLITYSQNLLNEAMSYQYVSQERMKAEAARGETDDELVAAMIALVVREQEPIGLDDERGKPEVYAEL